MSFHEFTIDDHTEVVVEFEYHADSDESRWSIHALWSSLPDPTYTGPAWTGLPDDTLVLQGEQDPQAGLQWARSLAESTVR